MRRLVTMDSEPEARQFGTVLARANIDYSVDEQSVWVDRDEQLDTARSLLERWRESGDSDALAALVDQSRSRFPERQPVRVRRAPRVSPEARSARGRGSGLVTYAVIAMSVAATYAGIGSLGALADAITQLPAAERVSWLMVEEWDIVMAGEPWSVNFLHSVRSGEIWRLLSPVLVHSGGLFHLGFNVYWFLMFGRLIETRKGSAQLAWLVLLTGVASVLGQYVVGLGLLELNGGDFGLFGRIYFGGPVAGGLSGVLYGLFGYIVAKSYVDKFGGLGLPSGTVFFLVLWLLICFAGQPAYNQYLGTTVTVGVAGPIANIAHLVGLLSGGLWGLVSHRIHPKW